MNTVTLMMTVTCSVRKGSEKEKKACDLLLPLPLALPRLPLGEQVWMRSRANLLHIRLSRVKKFRYYFFANFLYNSIDCSHLPLVLLCQLLPLFSLSLSLASCFSRLRLSTEILSAVHNEVLTRYADRLLTGAL